MGIQQCHIDTMIKIITNLQYHEISIDSMQNQRIICSCKIYGFQSEKKYEMYIIYRCCLFSTYDILM
jgi:hypothetical protein